MSSSCSSNSCGRVARKLQEEARKRKEEKEEERKRKKEEAMKELEAALGREDMGLEKVVACFAW